MKLMNVSLNEVKGLGGGDDAAATEHRHKLVRGFTNKYNVPRLVFWQASESLESARAREKEIKGWRRSKKVELIEQMNPYWSDLARLWTEDSQPPQTLRPDENRDSGRHLKTPAHRVS